MGSIYLEEDSQQETLKDLLQLWTDYPQLPCDTLSKLCVKYCPQQPSKVVAEADTCSLTLRIPTTHHQNMRISKGSWTSIAHGKIGFRRM